MNLKILATILLLYSTFLKAEESCPIVDLALAEITKVRSLPIKKEIPCKKLTKDEIRSYLNQALKKKVTASRLEIERKVLVALKLIPLEYDYQEELISLYTDQIGGFYDPELEYFGTAAWIPENLQVPVAIHELTHGLQDQSFNLDVFTDAKLSTDDLLARSALAEGDASMTMLLVGKNKSGADSRLSDNEIKSFSNSTLQSSLMNKKLSETPKAIRAMLTFPYSKGTEYVHSLFKQNGWDSVNAKYKLAPKGTAEILGFKVEELNEETKSALTCSPATKQSELIYEDTLGALYLGYVLGEDALEKPISNIWKGDRICVYKEEDSIRLIWAISIKKNITDVSSKLKSNLGPQIKLANQLNLIEIELEI